MTLVRALVPRDGKGGVGDLESAKALGSARCKLQRRRIHLHIRNNVIKY